MEVKEEPHELVDVNIVIERISLQKIIQLTNPQPKPGSKSKCPYSCPYEAKMSYVKTHCNNIHIGEKPHICNLCGEKFKKPGRLTTHIRKVHSSRQELYLYTCRLCNKSFRRDQNRKIHEKQHTGQVRFNCRYCDVALSSNQYRKMHEMTHTGQTRFRCSYCDKGFIQKPHLDAHVRAHLGERPHGCRFCDKWFTQTSHRQVHEREHTGERPNKCGFCPATFTSATNLQRHIRKYHTIEKPYKCHFCEEEFNYTTSLKWHEKVHTGERYLQQYECQNCGKLYRSKNGLKRHNVKCTDTVVVVKMESTEPTNFDMALIQTEEIAIKEEPLDQNIDEFHTKINLKGLISNVNK